MVCLYVGNKSRKVPMINWRTSITWESSGTRPSEKSIILCILWAGAVGQRSDYGSPEYELNSWYVLLYTKQNPRFHILISSHSL